MKGPQNCPILFLYKDSKVCADGVNVNSNNNNREKTISSLSLGSLFCPGNVLCSVDSHSWTHRAVFRLTGSPSVQHLITSTGRLLSHETGPWGTGSPPLPQSPLSIYKHRSSVSQFPGPANVKVLSSLGQKLPTLMGSRCRVVACLLHQPEACPGISKGSLQAVSPHAGGNTGL